MAYSLVVVFLVVLHYHGGKKWKRERKKDLVGKVTASIGWALCPCWCCFISTSTYWWWVYCLSTHLSTAKAKNVLLWLPTLIYGYPRPSSFISPKRIHPPWMFFCFSLTPWLARRIQESGHEGHRCVLHCEILCSRWSNSTTRNLIWIRQVMTAALREPCQSFYSSTSRSLAVSPTYRDKIFVNKFSRANCCRIHQVDLKNQVLVETVEITRCDVGVHVKPFRHLDFTWKKNIISFLLYVIGRAEVQVHTTLDRFLSSPTRWTKEKR